MNEFQRRYTVNLIEKHKDEVKEENDFANENKWYTCGAIAVACVFFSLQKEFANNPVESLITGTIGLGGLVSIPVFLRNMIVSLTKKTGIEFKIEDLKQKIELSKFNDINQLESIEKGKNI